MKQVELSSNPTMPPYLKRRISVILQRLAKSLSLQHWGAALLEILIVVIGIFLGLQVDDWNQQRKDRGDEKIFLNRMHDDLLVADELSSRLRQRRQDRLGILMSAADVLMSRDGRNTPTNHRGIIGVRST